MRILFTTWAWPSHYFPMVPLAWALTAAGHDVRVATPPALTGLVVESGLMSVEVGEDVNFVDLVAKVMNFQAPEGGGSAEEWEELRKSRGAQSLGMFAAVADAMVDDLIEFAEKWQPDLIVYDATTYAGPIAAAKIKRPAVRHLFGPDMMWRARPFESAILQPVFSRLGLDDVDTIGTLSVDPCPPSLQIPTTPNLQTMRYAPYNGSGSMPRWLLDPPDPSRPRICLTSGTSIPSFGRQMMFIPEAADALSGADVEVIVAISARHRDVLGTLPDGIRVVESLPLRLLLPTCAAVIHHGGAGTSLTSLLNGLPQLVIAQLPDQMFTAGQLAATGAARQLMREELTPDRLSAELKMLIDDPSCRAAAEGVRAEMLAQPRVTDAVKVLEDLT